MLLGAYDDGKGGQSQVRFAQAVFGRAGKGMLALLHEALRSKDRVVRSNAARGCGAIGDASSIGPLVAALDLESGLSRASIVWALGELKAAEAMEQLAALYVDARQDEERRRGSGFRAAQSAAQIGAQYDAIADFASIGDDWEALSTAVGRARREGEGGTREALLTPGIVLEAVRKIGNEATQAFYRKLAGERDAEARMEAAVQLATSDEESRAENVAILRNLLGDGNRSVRMRAAASLLVMGERGGREMILGWLGSPSAWEKCEVLEQLLRVESAEALAFAREAIAAIAAGPSLGWRDGKKVAEQLMGRMSPE